MRKNKVDRAIEIVINFKKVEVKEFCDRMAKEHSVTVIMIVPFSKIAEPIGYWLKKGTEGKE